MNIAIDSRAAIWYRGTGMGTYTYQLIRNLHLIDKKNTYHFWLPAALNQAPALDLLNGGIFQSIEQTKTKFWEALVAQPLQWEHCPIAPGLVHIPHNGIGCHWLTEPSLAPPCPTVVTIHDLIPYACPETVGSYYLAVFLKTMPKILANSSKIIAVSQHTKKDLIQRMGVPPEKIQVVYEAPEPIYKPLNREKARAKIAQKYGIEDPFILYLGGFSPRKNIVGLLQAFAAIYQDLPQPTKLVIVGRASAYSAQLQRWVEKLGLQQQVVFTGFATMQDLPLFYNACRVFAYPSFYEGFGLPPLEAMACGTPTLVGNNSSLPEIVGEGAFKVDPYQPLQMGAALFALCTDQGLRSNLSGLALKRAQQFSWTKAAAQTLKVYQEVASATDQAWLPL